MARYYLDKEKTQLDLRRIIQEEAHILASSSHGNMDAGLALMKFAQAATWEELDRFRTLICSLPE